jgi:hypothetical protein
MHLDRSSVFERNRECLTFFGLALKDQCTRAIFNIAHDDGRNNTSVSYANLVIDFNFIGFDEGHDLLYEAVVLELLFGETAFGISVADETDSRMHRLDKLRYVQCDEDEMDAVAEIVTQFLSLLCHAALLGFFV